MKEAVIAQANKTFAASDAVMGRCISTLINLSWTEQQLKEKGQALVSAITKVLAKETV